MTPALDGVNAFHRVNPAAGATWISPSGPPRTPTGARACECPSPVELTCADPDAPCTLPNIFVADPPLLPVIGTTLEVGARGQGPSAASTGCWNAASIAPTSRRHPVRRGRGGAVNSGYFQNIGRTRRDGLELGMSVPFGPVSLTARYSYTRATFETGIPRNEPEQLDGQSRRRDRRESRATASRGFRATAQAARRLDATVPVLDVGATIVAASSQYARGNENNLDPTGLVPGYAVVNLDARSGSNPRWEVFANVTNLSTRAIRISGFSASIIFRGPGNAYAPALAGPEQFRSPGRALRRLDRHPYAFSGATALSLP